MTTALIIPYYEDPDRLEGILYNDCTFKYFDKVIIIDDASPNYPAKPIVQSHIEECCCNRKKVMLYRVAVDYGFNAHGARNLGASVAAGHDWLMFMDVDQELTEDFCEALQKDIAASKEGEYVLCNLFGGDPGNIFACRRSDFFAAGGYDEELRGWHMGDKLFRDRLDQIASPKLMDTILPSNRMGRKIVIDNEVTGTEYPDDKTVKQRDQRGIEPMVDLVKSRNLDPKLWKNIEKITFDWKRQF